MILIVILKRVIPWWCSSGNGRSVCCTGRVIESSLRIGRIDLCCLGGISIRCGYGIGISRGSSKGVRCGSDIGVIRLSRVGRISSVWCGGRACCYGFCRDGMSYGSVGRVGVGTGCAHL